MQISDAIDFLRDKRHGTLITQRANGRPQSSNIVYLVDGDEILVSLTASRAKTKNLVRTPVATLHVNRDDFWAFAVLDVDVELSAVTTDPTDEVADRLVEYYRVMSGEHPDWDEYRAAMVEEGRQLATLTATHAYGMLNR